MLLKPARPASQLRLVPLDPDTLAAAGEPLAPGKSLAEARLAEGTVLGLLLAKGSGWEALSIEAPES